MKESVVEWVTLDKYQELTGETPNAVRIRRKRHVWQDGKHTRIAANGRIWVNLKEAQQWARESGVG